MAPSVQRVMPTKELTKAALANINSLLATEFQSRLEATRAIDEGISGALAPVRRLIEQDDQAASSLKALQSAAKKESERVFKQNKKQLELNPFRNSGPEPFFTVTPGGNFPMPPYDVEWTLADTRSLANKATGKLSVESFSGGVASAALGVYLTAPKTVRLQCRPYLTYDFQWADLAGPFDSASTDGGVGVLIYKGSEVVLDNRALLWSDSRGAPGFAGWSSLGQGAGHGPLTYTSVALNDFTADAGATYLVFVWCWAFSFSNFVGQALLNCDMPWIYFADRF